MPVLNYKEFVPKIGKSVWIAPTAYVTGKCEIADDVAIFFGAALRGDVNKIIVGRGTNIQDNAVLHTSWGLGDCIVGEDVTIGHCAILHGCEVKSRCIIGMNATILDNAVVGEGSIIGAQSLVTMGTIIPPGSLAFGNPAKVIRALNEEEKKLLIYSAQSYQEKGRTYAAQG